MAYNYPYFYSPSRRYSNYTYMYPNYYGQSYSPKKVKEIKQKDKKIESVLHFDNEQEGNKKSEESRECFEVFGIKLFFDDILLICLIFFLYNEGVKDQYLFISLILLLLS